MDDRGPYLRYPSDQTLMYRHFLRPVRGLGCLVMVAVVLFVLVNFWQITVWVLGIALAIASLYALGWAVEKEGELTRRGPHKPSDPTLYP